MKKLYKYLSTQRIDVLEKKKIRFTQPKYLNDPFESLPAMHKVMTDGVFNAHLENELEAPSLLQLELILREKMPFLSQEQIREFLKNPLIEKIIDDVRSETINSAKEFLTTSDADSKLFLSKSFQESASSSIGVLSLSEVFDNQLMWANYAENSQGFIIGFDTNHSFFNQKKFEADHFRFVRPVMYSYERPEWPTIFENMDEHTFTIHLVELVFTKSKEWEKEKEWRMVMPLKEATEVDENDVFLFTIPPSCVAEVLLGTNINGMNKNKIVTVIRNDKTYLHVKLKQAVIKAGYGLSFIDVI